MNALVTGATGFIGSVLVRELIDQGCRVRALALPGEDTGRLEKLGIDVQRGDLTRPETLSGVCRGTDAVFHLAGRVVDWGTRGQFYRAIYHATLNLLLEASGTASRFVYISSIAAIGFGRHMKGIRESDPVFKSGIPYNDAKLDAERLVWNFHNTGKISCTVIRPANVTGPGSVWVKDIVEKMLNMPMPLIDGGRHSASLIYVDNLVDGIIRAGTRDIARGKTYQLRDDWDVTWKRYIADLGNFIGQKPSLSIPYLPASIAGRFMDLVCTPLGIRPPISRMSVDIVGRDNDVDTSLAKDELEWRTRVAYPEAMEHIGAWVRQNYGRG
ncbi:MAG TPA: NAD-dependent epimerase/dehydratase family protein [Deltaproteobacteria bacterium]|nr:NAD-dependent epimerase/dehydratase family protein [Deltaproteobacteria bacterium]HXK46174.1 NAD-dependent epimerase/dehydratase family protein [Deltaproteobacteria bacterium]